MRIDVNVGHRTVRGKILHAKEAESENHSHVGLALVEFARKNMCERFWTNVTDGGSMLPRLTPR